jgi:2',3'-cyclic-nucleotide 2'-phosphodiesterase/3'-nucleotidase
VQKEALERSGTMAGKQHIDRREVLLGGTAAGVALLAGQALAQAGPRASLRVLATTDLHVNVLAYDYFREAPDNTVGLAKTAALIAAARAEARNTVLFDNGDTIQGSPLGDYVAYRRGMQAGQQHPMIAAMNALDYACGTLGNHEFNYGLDFLASAFAGANFPAVCANVVKPDGTPLVRPWLVLDREIEDSAGAKHRLKLGVIGFVPPQIMQWDKAHLEGRTRALDIVEAARAEVPKLKAAGADIVVALCHSGISANQRAGGDENAGLYLAGVEGIDALILGHQHLVFPGATSFNNLAAVDNKAGTLAGKPAVMPGFWGSHLGVIDLDLVQTGGRWSVAGHKVEARPIFERTADRRIVPKVEAVAAVAATVKADHEATLAYVRTPVSATSAPITSYFAMVADDPSIQIVTNAQAWYVKQLVAGTPYAGLPILSAGAPFKAGGRGGPGAYTDVKAGPITIKDLADIYIFPNTLQVVKVTGAQVREWLERSAGAFNRIDVSKGSTEQPLLDTRFPAFNFDIIDGVSYAIDVTQPSRYDLDGKLVEPNARRITDLMFDGKPIVDTQEFVLATNNYRASGGGNFPGTKTTVIIEAPDLNRDVIMRYLIELKQVNPTADGNWRLAPLPAGLNVTFVTGPAAAPFLPRSLNAVPAGEAADGFVKYRLAS